MPLPHELLTNYSHQTHKKGALLTWTPEGDTEGDMLAEATRESSGAAALVLEEAAQAG